MIKVVSILKTRTVNVWAMALLIGGAAAQTAFAQTYPGSYPTGPFTAGNLVVHVIGDGKDALSSSATRGFLLEFTTSGATKNIFSLPYVSSTNVAALNTSGVATSEGAVTLSTDGKYLVVVGYDAATGTATIATSASAAAPRAIGALDWKATVPVISTLRTTAFSGNNIRSAVSDGTQFWAAGATGGINYFASLSATSPVAINATPSNLRYVNIFNGQLYATASVGVHTIGTGLPTTTGQAANLLSGFASVTGLSSYDFYVTPTADAVYVVDDGAVTGTGKGGLQKWTNNGSGTYSLAYTLKTGLTAGLRSLAFGGVDSSGNNIFYATDAATLTNLVTVTDAGASASFTKLATAPTNTAFRGVEFLPTGQVSASPPDTMITGGPASGATIGTTSATFTFTGTDPVTPPANLTYQVSVDGGAFSTPASAITFTLSGLTDGAHTFAVAAVNAANLADPTPASVTFYVDTVLPTISDLTATGITDTAATITWTTNRPASSLVEHRVQGNPTWIPIGTNSALVTAHSVALSSLTANTTYEYRARSTDGLGQEVVSSVQTFTTLSKMPPPPAASKIRIAQWNVTSYSSGRVSDFQTAVYSSYQGRSMSPDIFIGEEFQNPTAITNFLAILNTAPGSPGDWAAAPWEAGTENVPDTNTAFFYRTSRVNFLAIILVAQSSGATTDQPRNTYRYDVSLKGAGTPAPILAVYATHEKSGSASADSARRQIESLRIRNNAATLPTTWYYLLGGDLNAQDSAQQAYQTLVTPGSGAFYDPIKTPGSWNNNAAFKFVHTQDPSGMGGMDDRHDQILLSANLIDGVGLDYDGNPNIPYSTTTWDDPNHSYRSWGNDGTSFDANLTIANNAMVGPTIAQALFNSAQSGGHLPVFLDLKIPAPTATISGNILLDSLSTKAPAQPVVVLLHPSDNSGDITQKISLDSVGAFSLSGLPRKNYTLHIKGSKWLAVNLAADASAGDVSGLNAMLPGGDSDNNNTVDVLDFGALVNAYGADSAVAGSGYDETADFNSDGVVDVLDFGILVNNYGTAGAPLP